MQSHDQQILAKLTERMELIKQLCTGAKLLPDYGSYKFDGRYAVNPLGKIIDLHRGLELLPGAKGQVKLMQLEGQLSITPKRALALAFFGVKAVDNKKVHLINSKLPLSIGNLQVCKSYNNTAGGVHLK